MSQMCSKCGNAFVDTSGFVLAGPIKSYRSYWATEADHIVPLSRRPGLRLFCSLDCLSRWVEAQRLIAVVEERP